MSEYVSAELRREVRARSQERCEYCFIPEGFSFAPHEIDHIIARKHSGETVSLNLALSCTLCNKLKGSDIASLDRQTDAVTRLYHPRRDRWQEHFQLEGAQFIPLTDVGRVTVFLLQLNRPDRLSERQLMQDMRLLHIPE
jgi:hypothetical protein